MNLNKKLTIKKNYIKKSKKNTNKKQKRWWIFQWKDNERIHHYRKKNNIQNKEKNITQYQD